jgi:hypothetical protein
MGDVYINSSLRRFTIGFRNEVKIRKLGYADKSAATEPRKSQSPWDFLLGEIA